jgi:uncharacterized protein with FMN-binding domain
MRRIVFAIMSTITTLVLLFSYHTSTNSAAGATFVASPAAELPASPPATGPSASASPPGSPKVSAPPTSKPKPMPTHYTGGIADTRWGPVQVRITVFGGKITASEAVRHPQGNGRDAEINGYALPILNQKVVRQQSAAIDTVSGATVTSDGYRQSLQSAIDRAHL